MAFVFMLSNARHFAVLHVTHWGVGTGQFDRSPREMNFHQHCAVFPLSNESIETARKLRHYDANLGNLC